MDSGRAGCAWWVGSDDGGVGGGQCCWWGEVCGVGCSGRLLWVAVLVLPVVGAGWLEAVVLGGIGCVVVGGCVGVRGRRRLWIDC